MNTVVNVTAEARDHHYVPRFLLRAWATNDLLRGYWWNPWKNALDCKNRGVTAFCNQVGLLTLTRHELGRDAIERLFFGFIDTRGAVVYDKMLTQGVGALTGDERCDFARFLLSLEMRKPETVAKLQQESLRWADQLNGDAELLALMSEKGITKSPVEYWLGEGGDAFIDRAVMLIQQLVDNKMLVPLLINAHWHIVTLNLGEETFILADRPLMRFGGLGDPNCLWVLPLTPFRAFIAAPRRDTVQAILRARPRKLAINANLDSARHAERFVFSIEERHGRWLGKYLRDKPHVAAHVAPQKIHLSTYV